MHKQPTSQNTVLFLGIGYTATYLMDTLKAHSWAYHTLSTRHREVLAPELLAQVTHVILTSPPNKKDDATDIELDYGFKHYQDLIIKQASMLKWVGYLSATSVYGDHAGAMVNEATPCTPSSERGIKRLKAEQLWQNFAQQHNLPLHIFRLAGIYGPDRNTIENVRCGKAVNIIKPNHLVNRIYVKDIAYILFQSMQNPTSQQIFNLTDDKAASTAAINDYIAFLLNKPKLPKVDYDSYKHNLTKMRQSFYQESKIVSNNKIKQFLKINLLFPSYYEGIADILQSELMQKNSILH